VVVVTRGWTDGLDGPARIRPRRPDAGFGSGGLATTAFSTQHDYAHGLALQFDGKIVVVGQSSNLMDPDFAIARFTTGGTLDTGFIGGGKLTVDFFDSFDGAECPRSSPTASS
jgi:hypothetical protein